MSDLPPPSGIVQHPLPAQLIHDLRTPLGHVKGYAELLREQAREAGDTEYLPFIEKIQTAAEQLLALINANFTASPKS